MEDQEDELREDLDAKEALEGMEWQENPFGVTAWEAPVPGAGRTEAALADLTSGQGDGEGEEPGIGAHPAEAIRLLESGKAGGAIRGGRPRPQQLYGSWTKAGKGLPPDKGGPGDGGVP